MSEPTRIRAVMQGGKVDVRMRVARDTGMGSCNATDDNLVPAWFVQRVSVTHRGRMVFSAQCGPMVSKNPQFNFRFSGAKPGDPIVVTWIDNRGQQRGDEALIAAS